MVLRQFKKTVLLRAAWTMLYAHYEGYSKFCLVTFYDEATKRLDTCEALPPRTKAFALQTHLKKLKTLSTLEFVGEVETFTDFTKNTKPSFPDVDTKSNLWPSVLQELLSDADIIIDAINKHAVKLKTLVARRNDIAHGQKSFINEIEYYITYEQSVYEIMYQLAYSVSDRLNRPPYVR